MVRYSHKHTQKRKPTIKTHTSPTSIRKTRRVHAKPATNKICSPTMSFQECELAILRHAVDTNEKQRGEKVAQNPEIIEMFGVVEDFIRKHKLICYGGTAINNILPASDQFYNREVDIPDYDFFSLNAMKHAKQLADIYYQHGYTEVEAKAGVHKGTYKVFVNFIPVADITQLHEVLFHAISKDAVVRDGIMYAPPNFLRMSMYLELSRPQGDVSRWEKVLKRMNLLNKHYPVAKPKQCRDFSFQRKMERNKKEMETIAGIVRDVFMQEECVFFGSYASALYVSRTDPSDTPLENIPDFDVLSKEPKRVALLAKKELERQGYKGVKLFRHTPMGEIIPEHYELILGVDTLAFVYSPISCHSYNTVMLQGKPINIATIDTMLSLYLAFLYADKPYFDETRIFCLAELLFKIQRENRLKQSGILKRFTLQCYGEQETLEKIRAKKTRMFAKLKKGTTEYEEWFLKYNPALEPKNRRKRKQNTKSVAASTQPSSGENISYEIIETEAPSAPTPHPRKRGIVPKRSEEGSETETDTSDEEEEEEAEAEAEAEEMVDEETGEDTSGDKSKRGWFANRRRSGFLY